jgi:hypothetical protein
MLRNLDTCFQGVITYIQGCLILVLLGLSGSTQATTYYLAPTGVDSGPCTVQTQPCLSLERADALVNPGDEVRLAGGLQPGCIDRLQWDSISANDLAAVG